MRFDDDDDERFLRHLNNDDEQGEEWKLKPRKDSATRLIKIARQIMKTTEAIIETLPEEEDKHMSHYREWMMENSLKIIPKISGAMATGDYILMTENATIIKLAARELLTQTSGLKMFGYKHTDYLNALREEIEEFRKEFVVWVRTFEKEDPIYPDGWGLYYTEEDLIRWNAMNPDDQRNE